MHISVFLRLLFNIELRLIAWALIFNGNNKNEVAEDNESDEGALGEYNFEVVEIPEESYVD